MSVQFTVAVETIIDGGAVAPKTLSLLSALLAYSFTPSARPSSRDIPHSRGFRIDMWPVGRIKNPVPSPV